MKILVVDDERTLVKGIKFNLENVPMMALPLWTSPERAGLI